MSKEVILSPTIQSEIEELNLASMVISIANNEQYEQAAAVLIEVKERRKAVADFFCEHEKVAYSGWKGLVASRKTYTDKLDIVEGKYKAAMIYFQKEQEKARKELEVKLLAEAEQKAAKERTKLQKQADRAEEKGQNEKASQLNLKADLIVAAAPMVQSHVANVAGIRTKKIWKVKVTNKEAFLRAAIENHLLLKLVEINESALLKTRDVFTELPGINFYQEDVITVKSMAA